MSKLETKGREFIYDGKPLRILSGAIHYFRVLPEQWRDRLLKLKACGLNTVETYVPWNLHEPKEGEFNFEGICDLVGFIKIAEELGLYVIVRPSPYICAEWEFGGLPSWLLAEQGMRLRCHYKPFFDKVEAYYDVLMPKLVPLLSTNGGPIIAMQIENEYGSYGNDKQYLSHLEKAMTSRGIDVLLFTSDGPGDQMLEGGTLPHILKTVNFGSQPEPYFNKLLEHQPDKPLMCMEFWIGWFDQWGNDHVTREGSDVAKHLEKLLEMGASVNFYMFHGGTNFGFLNGANCTNGNHTRTVTSYDYDSLLTEAGDPTEKYYAVQEVLSKYVDIDKNLMPEASKKNSYGKVKLTKQADLFQSLNDLSAPIKCACPETMEVLGQDYGFILYETKVKLPKVDPEDEHENKLILKEVRDRALIFIDDEFIGIIDRNDEKQSIELKTTKDDVTIKILVENLARTNYGKDLKDPKGITEGVLLNYQYLFDWTIYTLPLNNLSPLKFSENMVNHKTPKFYKGSFDIDEVADTYIQLEEWEKCVVYINGFNIGRYWQIGPQKTLYVPAPLLKEGENEIIVFELHNVNTPIVDFVDKPQLG